MKNKIINKKNQYSYSLDINESKNILENKSM